jgi:branched-chain amino acid transport system ATP-binding protein
MSLIIRNLTVDHGAIRAINNLSFIVEKRRLTAVIGANMFETVLVMSLKVSQ